RLRVASADVLAEAGATARAPGLATLRALALRAGTRFLRLCDAHRLFQPRLPVQHLELDQDVAQLGGERAQVAGPADGFWFGQAEALARFLPRLVVTLALASQHVPELVQHRDGDLDRALFERCADLDQGYGLALAVL